MVPTKLLKRIARWALRRELASLRLTLYMVEKELRYAEEAVAVEVEHYNLALASRDRWKTLALHYEAELALYRTVTINPISEGTA